jgi:hypothetical protein
VLGEPSVAAREADTRKLYAWAFRLYHRVRPISPNEVLARATIRYRRGAELNLVPGATGRRFVVRRGRHLRKCGLRVPDEVAGPIASGDKLGEVDICRGQGEARDAAGGRVRRRPAAGSASAPRTASRAPGSCSWSCRPRWPVRLRSTGSAGGLERPPALTRGAGGSMIITVTLNTAIDKTLAVPNFRLGRRHRTVEQTRCRAARASTSRACSRRSASR